VRRIVSRRHPIAWITPTTRILYSTLHHPIYAGAYVHGRAKTVREVDAEGDMQVRKRMRRVAREEWPVLIKDHHPAYIPYDKFLENLRRLEANRVMRPNQDQSEKGPAREGRALLQGLARCGECGRRMGVSYGGATGRRTLQYRCQQLGKDCQLIGGERIERAVVEAFLRACEHAGEEAALLVQEQSQQQGEDVERAWRLQIEKAEYEAQRAERQYDAVEPENRVVARELERRWNARMEELDVVRAKAREAHARRPALTNEELAMAHTLGGDLQAVWNAPTTEARDRKRLLRTLIEEVQLRTEEKRHLVRIVWKGGATTDREIVRLRGGQLRATSEDTIDLVRKLAVDLDNAQIARTLNRQGRRSGLGRAFTSIAIHSLRQKNQIPGHSHRVAKDPTEGPFTAEEAAERLGVAHTTVIQWLHDGMLAGEQLTPGAPWRIVLSEDTRRRLAGGDAPAGWVTLTAAAQRLGMSKSHVVYLVKTGKLPAMRTKVGKRQCWKIDVSTAERGPQGDMFEQKITARSGGS
jgi:excisionase family DNA binding protein